MTDEPRPVPRRLAARSRARHDRDHALVDHDKPFSGRVPGSAVGAVQRVVRFDGRTRVLAARRPGGTWHHLARRTRFTRAVADHLRQAGYSEVVLKRGLRSASFPLGWISRREE